MVIYQETLISYTLLQSTCRYGFDTIIKQASTPGMKITYYLYSERASGRNGVAKVGMKQDITLNLITSDLYALFTIMSGDRIKHSLT